MSLRIFFAFFMAAALTTMSYAGVSSSPSTVTGVRPVSQYGLIQNVQNYSSNPFWTTSSQYNQKFPQAVYVKGPELTSADCIGTVGTLVSAYCSANNNCIGMMLSDIRPTIMLQLSRLPGHNYATACAGYIDSEFDRFIESYSGSIPNYTVSFPTPTVANPNANEYEFKLENPYERKDGTWNGVPWQQERRERTEELQELQSMNGVGSEHIESADFPTTFADLSLMDQNRIKQLGYEPYKNASAYVPIKLESEDAYLARVEARKKAELAEYCKKHPEDEDKCGKQRTTGGKGTQDPTVKLTKSDCKCAPGENVSSCTADLDTTTNTCTVSYECDDGFITLGGGTTGSDTGTPGEPQTFTPDCIDPLATPPAAEPTIHLILR